MSTGAGCCCSLWRDLGVFLAACSSSAHGSVSVQSWMISAVSSWEIGAMVSSGAQRSFQSTSCHQPCPSWCWLGQGLVAVLGMGLHCRCWLRKRGRMQSHRVCLEEGSHRRLLPCVVWQEPAGNRAVLGSCWGSREGWFCLCSISWRGWQSRGQESTELQDR